MQSEDCLSDGEVGPGEAAWLSDDCGDDGELCPPRPPPLVLHTEERSPQLLLSLRHGLLL